MWNINLSEKERIILAPYAVKSDESVGRKFEETDGDERLCFQKDKDRIVHCKAFRRLEQKTQVFMAGAGDHYRTRLTHTLEVTQISRDIARRLSLNEDLCEAVALAHDLGHPPFGHAGESALNEAMSEFGGHFEHNEQSRRVVEVLEKAYPEFDGLNLTFEVLDGLIKHRTSWDQPEKKFETSAHLEAQIVNIADEIAYTNHDMDDGLRSGIIKIPQLRKLELWTEAEEEVSRKHEKSLEPQVLISRVTSSIMSGMIDDLCAQTTRNIQNFKIKSVDDVKKTQLDIAKFSEKMDEKLSRMRKFLYSNFYMGPQIGSFTIEGKKMIKSLFNYYMQNPDKFPKNEAFENEKDLVVAVKDYIAGMTDGFLVKEFEKSIK